MLRELVSILTLTTHLNVSMVSGNVINKTSQEIYNFS